MPSSEHRPSALAEDWRNEDAVAVFPFAAHEAVPLSGTLSSEHRLILIELIESVHGAALSEADFADALLLLLEDVSGFEHPKPGDLSRLIDDLWGRYVGARGAGF